MGTKLNPDKYDCYNKLADDEPQFTLRAKDEDAPDLVMMWVAIRRAKWKATHPNKPMPMEYIDKLVQAERIALEMMSWKAKQQEILPEERKK